MAITEAISWQSFEKRSSAAFLFAGVAWAGDAALNLYELVSGLDVPNVLIGVFVASALLGTTVAVIGFHRSIADRSYRLAFAGTVPIALAGIIALITLVWIVIAGILNQPSPPGSTGIAIIVLVAVGLLSFGGASFHTRAPSRIVGLLLLAILAVFVLFLAAAAGLYELVTGADLAFLVSLSVISLAIGYRLRTIDWSPDRSASSPEPAP